MRLRQQRFETQRQLPVSTSSPGTKTQGGGKEKKRWQACAAFAKLLFLSLGYLFLGEGGVAQCHTPNPPNLSRTLDLGIVTFGQQHRKPGQHQPSSLTQVRPLKPSIERAIFHPANRTHHLSYRQHLTVCLWSLPRAIHLIAHSAHGCSAAHSMPCATGMTRPHPRCCDL